MKLTTKSALYLALIVAAVLVAIDIWYVTNVLEARKVGFLLWEGGLAMLLFLAAAVLTFSYVPKDSSARNGMLIVLGIFMFDALVMLNYATVGDTLPTTSNCALFAGQPTLLRLRQPQLEQAREVIFHA